jgi:hypothetical protein
MRLLVQRQFSAPRTSPWQAVGEIVPFAEARRGGTGPTFATVVESNGLGRAGPPPEAVFACDRVVLPSGWIEPEQESDDAGPGFADPRTWGPSGWGRFESFCRELLARPAADSARLCFRPRATDVLSDAPSCARFLREKARWGDREGLLEILLDPVAMLTPVMLGAAEDHLSRILAYLGAAPGVCAVVLTNVESDPQRGRPRASPVHKGLLPPSSLARLARETVPPAIPIVLLDDELEGQRACLGV